MSDSCRKEVTIVKFIAANYFERLDNTCILMACDKEERYQVCIQNYGIVHLTRFFYVS